MDNTINELYDNIKLGLLERIHSPLTFALFVSWSIINYEVLVIIFTSGSALDKLNLIESEVFPNKDVFLQHGVIYPFLAAAAYIFIYPLLAASALWMHTKYKNLFKRIKDGELLSKVEGEKIKNEIIDVKNLYEEKLFNKDSELDKLRVKNEDLIRQLQEYDSIKVEAEGDTISNLNYQIEELKKELNADKEIVPVPGEPSSDVLNNSSNDHELLKEIKGAGVI